MSKCEDCGYVRPSPDDITLFINFEDDSSREYQFVCPSCGLTNTKTADDLTRQAIIDMGCKIAYRLDS